MSAQIAAYGRLAADPRPIQTRTGKPMTTARLAVTLEDRSQGAEEGAEVESYDCIADAVVSARTVRPRGGGARRDGARRDDGGAPRGESGEQSRAPSWPGGGHPNAPGGESPPPADFDDDIPF